MHLDRMMILLAKSEKQGGLLLVEHTRHVVDAIEVMASGYGFDLKLAKKGAVLHDLGKGHPAFQAMLIEKPLDQQEKWLAKLPAARAIKKELFFRADGRNLYHRHELSSLLFLPLFERKDWPSLIDMVVAHHKSVVDDRRELGLLDLIEKWGGWEPIFERHADAWEDWAQAALEVATHFGVQSRSIGLQEAQEAFQFVCQYVKDKPDGQSQWRGLLMSADHFASGYQHDTSSVAQGLFAVPDLRFFHKRTQTPGASLYPLTQVSVENHAPHTMVTAPTGAGKTDFLMRRCRGRVFYTLPFQASINAMFKRMVQAMPGADVRRLHSASRVDLDAEENEDVDLQRHPGASVKVMTPHQLASIVFGTPGHEATALDLAGNDVILDEVHTYDGLARSMIVQMVRSLVHLGCRVHIGTATIPAALSDALEGVLGGKDTVYRVKLEDEVLKTFNRHTIYKIPGESEAKAVVEEAVARNERVLFVSNQVKVAQERYRWVVENFGEEMPSLLLHSRFRRGERSELEDRIMRFEEGSPCVVCATQVVEVSLDISFDCMITDAAPLDSLVQRFGRVNRVRNADTIGRLKPIYVIAPPEDDKAILPYDAGIVRKSFEVLPDGEALQECTVQSLIDQVYPEIEVPDAAVHFIMQENGEYRIKELQHRKKSAIVEALEIIGRTAILKSDVACYCVARADERISLEIPIPGKGGLVHQIQKYSGHPPIEYGSYPLVVPDEWYHPEGLPLGLIVPSRQQELPDSFQQRIL